MKIRSSRTQTLSAKTKHSFSSNDPSFVSCDPRRLRSKTKQIRSSSDLPLRLYSQNCSTIQYPPSLNEQTLRSKRKSILLTAKSSILCTTYKIRTTNLNERRYNRAQNDRRRKRIVHFDWKNSISVSKLKECNQCSIGYQLFLKQENTRVKTLNQVMIPKVNWKYYEGEEVTPRVTQFRIILEGDPITKILGSHQNQDFQKRYKNLNERLLNEIPMYRSRSRTPKSVTKWNY